MLEYFRPPMQKGLILYFTLCLSMSPLGGAEPRDYYFGEGIGFSIPEAWTVIENHDAVSQKNLKDSGVSLDGDQLERLKDHRSVYFVRPSSAVASLISVDVLFGSVSYSKLLMDTFMNLSRKYLEKKGYLLLGEKFTTKINIGGVASPTLVLEARFSEARYDYLATLIPAGDRIVVIHGFTTPEDRDWLRQELQVIFDSFNGAKAGNRELDQSLFLLQIMLVILALVFLNFAKKGGGGEGET